MLNSQSKSLVQKVNVDLQIFNYSDAIFVCSELIQVNWFVWVNDSGEESVDECFCYHFDW